MDIKEQLKKLHERVKDIKNSIKTEEATKNAFIMPFLQILGYDIFNPVEVVPEFVADIGSKKGEKVDYAIMLNDTPIIIMECKHWEEKLDRHNSQLHRYFSVAKSKFAILTNGIKYEFFTDIDKSNIMDKTPFLEVNINVLRDVNMHELSKFHKSNFNLDDILSSANSLKYIKSIRKEFEKELNKPSEEFTKLLISRCFKGKITSKRLKMFLKYTSKAVNLSINEVINARLKAALKKEEETQEEVLQEEPKKDKIITTVEELESFQIVRAILRKNTDVSKISYKDTQSYFNILFENNVRKPICRLYLDSRKKYIVIFDENKNGTKNQINTIDDIYNFTEELLNAADNYK